MTSQIPTKRRLAVLFAIPICFSLLFFAVTTTTEYMAAKFLDVENLLINLDALRGVAADVDTSERGFLLTADPQYLNPLRQASASMPELFQTTLEQAKNQDKDLQARVSHFVSLVRKRADGAERIVALERSGGLDTAKHAERPEIAEQTMNEIRSSVRDLHQRINWEQTRYARAQTRLNTIAFLIFAVGTSLMLVMLIRIYRAALDSLRARDAMYGRLQEMNANLEAEVDHRTRDLRAANDELQQFAYVASHDLQEPLRTVTSFSQLLEARYKGRLGEDADEFIGYIVNSSRRMTDLINGLLALVRVRREGQPAEPVSFEAMVADAKTILQASVRDSQAQILVEGELPALVVDRIQFMQVLENLFSNAIKYRSERPLVIRVAARRTATEWVFSVADNGRGFDQQYAARVFDLFQRLHVHEVPQGTGMGLSIARKVVERHGGHIWVESAAGVGSTFYFALPVSLDLSRETHDEGPPQKAFARSAG
ncbi:MAG: sensor histidine kinase [Bryobacteraceae bacterium]